MAEPYLSEIRIFGFSFPPRGWAQCDGQILPINQHQSLYSLLGTTYGGDGRTTFALPELRGRSAIHVGPGHTLGQRSGAERVQLTTAEIPSHDHELRGSSDVAQVPVPAGGSSAYVLGDSAPNEIYHTPTDLVATRGGSIANVGTGQGHENMQPYVAVNFCIAIIGTFPSRN